MNRPKPHISIFTLLFLCPLLLIAQIEGKVIRSFDTIAEQSQSIFGISVQNDSKRFHRLIEPTSPILGNKLVNKIRSDNRHPSEILSTIKSDYKNLKTEVLISSLAYFNILMPGLIAYSQQIITSTRPVVGMSWTEVEPAAIPLEVLTPLHEQYMDAVDSAFSFQQRLGYRFSLDSAVQLVTKYGNLKANCATIMPALKPKSIYTEKLPEKLSKLFRLNAMISSAEAAYPRLQHSINGYLQYTYSYLLQHEDLEGLLMAGYDAQSEWITAAREGDLDVPFMAHIEKSVLEQGFSYRDVLVLMCYSTRNMPNLDVQYIMDGEKALALEVYFWKYKEIQNAAIDQFFAHVFPNHVFKENPMLYHYATAAYLAYEVNRAGYQNGTAVGMAFLSKAGYKFHKFICALDPRAINNTGFGHFKDLLKKQSSMSGVKAGYFGGLHGVSMAKMEDRSESLNKRVNLLALEMGNRSTTE